MCLDEMEEFKGRDIAFVSDWLTKKLGTDRQIRRQGRAFEHYFGPRGGRGEFEQSNLQKFKCPWFARGGGGGMLKFRVDRCIN